MSDALNDCPLMRTGPTSALKPYTAAGGIPSSGAGRIPGSSSTSAASHPLRRSLYAPSGVGKTSCGALVIPNLRLPKRRRWCTFDRWNTGLQFLAAVIRQDEAPVTPGPGQLVDPGGPGP